MKQLESYNKMYKEYTIRELIQALKQAVENNGFLNEDSPVLISDYNMSGYKHKFKLHPVMSPVHSTAGLCLFHSLENRNDEEFKDELIDYRPSSNKEDRFLKFVRGIKG